jgi:hypothetical protein
LTNKERSTARNTKVVEAAFPFLVDLSKDNHLFNERLEKIAAFKDTESFSVLTKAEKVLINEQIATLEHLIRVINKRMSLY